MELRRRGLRRNGEKQLNSYHYKQEKRYKPRDPDEEDKPFYRQGMSAAERQRLIDLRDRLIEEYRRKLRY